VGKRGQCVRLTTLPPPCTVVKKSRNLKFLENSGMLYLYFTFTFTFTPIELKCEKFLNRECKEIMCVNQYNHTTNSLFYFLYSEFSLGSRDKFSGKSLHWKLRHNQMIYCYASKVYLITDQL